VGAVRIIGAVAIPHPVGNPELEPEKEYELRMSIVRKALEYISSDVNAEA